MFHVKHFWDDTIAAIATPMGLGGVEVVRLSGEKSVKIATKMLHCFPKKVVTRKIYRKWAHSGGRRIDEVLFFYMKSPNSYTGEDMVEISGHGGGFVLKKILEEAIANGARAAGPGEFTRRAFLNGKIDLLQAEAVQDIIQAKTERGVESAARQLGGELSKKIANLREKMIALLAQIEAKMDFPEDIKGIPGGQLGKRLRDAILEIESLLATAKEGRILREGVRVAIVGRPNVGKSSLLNALLGSKRAIVTEKPGTTRDTIEETTSIFGVPVIIIDTAGIRHPKDQAEEFGVERAQREMNDADLSLVVIDAARKLTDEDKRLLNEGTKGKKMMVLNKIDLGVRTDPRGYAKIKKYRASALTGEGVEQVKKGILLTMGMGNKNGIEGQAVCINLRQKECLIRAKEGLARAEADRKKGEEGEFIAIGIKDAIVALGEASGEEVSEEVINAVFEKFCIGK
jgi:tRNA modification GTPase